MDSINIQVSGFRAGPSVSMLFFHLKYDEFVLLLFLLFISAFETKRCNNISRANNFVL